MAMMLFEDFRSGALLGRHVETIDDALFAQWGAVFAGAGAPSPGGFATAFAMRAYLTILPERPPGNIHGRQRVTLHRAVTPGECVDTTLACVGQEVRGDRRMVSLAVHALTAVGPWFEAEMTILWAR